MQVISGRRAYDGVCVVTSYSCREARTDYSPFPVMILKWK